MQYTELQNYFRKTDIQTIHYDCYYLLLISTVIDKHFKAGNEFHLQLCSVAIVSETIVIQSGK